MRWIYISPHLDDAVLSAGGLIYEQTHAGNPVEIWTFLCGSPTETELSPFAQVLHHQWGMATAEEVVRGRREEDIKAVGLVGARAVHFDFFDCIYRRGKNGEWLYSDVFIPPHADDAELAVRIAETISARLQPDDKLICQLAIGSHVDHVLVRRAAELLGRPLYYDVDIPYHFSFPDELTPKTAGMKETVHPVSEAGLASWQEAVGAYASQLGMLFETDEAMRAKIRQYWSENKGICLWTFG
jgi:LmbE family N-acetylglucosaminyl deacetylase